MRPVGRKGSARFTCRQVGGRRFRLLPCVRFSDVMQRSLTMTVAALTTSSPPTCQRAKQAGRAKRATSYLLPSTSYLLPEVKFYKNFTSPRWQILPAPRRITIGEQHETDASRPPVARQEQNATLPRLRVQDAFRQHSCAFSRYHSPCWQPEKVAFFSCAIQESKPQGAA